MIISLNQILNLIYTNKIYTNKNMDRRGKVGYYLKADRSVKTSRRDLRTINQNVYFTYDFLDLLAKLTRY